MEKRTIFLIIALVISASLIIAGLMQEKTPPIIKSNTEQATTKAQKITYESFDTNEATLLPEIKLTSNNMVVENNSAINKQKTFSDNNLIKMVVN